MTTWQSELRQKLLPAAIIILAVIAGITAIIMHRTTGESGSGLGPEYDYDLSPAVRYDPNLLLYKSVSSISTGLDSARCIAVGPSGRLYVTGDKSLKMFEPSGSPVGGRRFDATTGAVAAASGGRLAVEAGGRVHLFDSRGGRISSWPVPLEGAMVTSIAISSRGDFFLADAGNRQVIVCDSEGRLANIIGTGGGFVIPSPYFDLAIAPDGLLRVVNPGRHRIETYTPEGEIKSYWGRFSQTAPDGFCGCCNPVNFAILPGGGFVTIEKGITRAKLYDSQGRFEGLVAAPEQLRSGPARPCNLPEECSRGGFDVAIAPTGMVYILDTDKAIVRVFTRRQP